MENIEELRLSRMLLCEVTNISSGYFGMEVWVSHQAFAAGKEWFKSVVGQHQVHSKGLDVWFSKNELAILEEY